jgi:hypothetical protein
MGSAATNFLQASRPPAEAPTATTGKSGPDATGARDSPCVRKGADCREDDSSQISLAFCVTFSGIFC